MPRAASRRAQAMKILRLAGAIMVVAVVAGLVVAGLTAPVASIAGLVLRDSTQTFDGLKVPALGQVPSRTVILDAQGKPIAYYYPNYIYRVPVSYQQISPSMRDAAVAIEDSRFYRHGALDVRGTLRAVITDLTSGRVQGGSTIAQQYVKNALILTATSQAERERAVAEDVARKIVELRIAVSVERELTPNQLLAAYLNVAYFENEAYGVQVAAERYFDTSAAKLTLTQSALLAGIVEDPSLYDPVTNPSAARDRRNVVLGRMADLHYISRVAAASAERQPLGLHMSDIPLAQGCYGTRGGKAAWFCDYVLAELRTNPAYRQAYADLNTVGGLRIYTTMNGRDQGAAQNAVTFMVPPPPSAFNPGHNGAAEVLIQPGTGAVKAIAVDRPYGTSGHADSIDYAVDTAQDGGVGVQTGSSSKLFTLITALKEGVPFGYARSVTSPTVLGPYYNCRGQYAGYFPVRNAEGAGKGTYTLYTATTKSINVFFAMLEQRVGLCNVVRTAVSMGLHRADGTSLLRAAGTRGKTGYELPADDLPSFTLGAVDVSPMSMAAAYATVASGGVYCRPYAIARIITADGRPLPVQPRSCHRVMSAVVADAATYILRGVLTSGTAQGDGVTRGGVYIPQAGKTGTANSFQFAAFGGYTPRLAGYVSMFNPTDPVTHPMIGSASCYRSSGGGLDCPGSVFGANAGQIWQLTFENADLGTGIAQFTPPPAASALFRDGNGQRGQPHQPHRPHRRHRPQHKRH
jgi:membrane peptidoglycan carboxypeptidase